MSTEEIVVKIIGKLDMEYKNLFNQQKVKSIIEEVLYDYDIIPAERALVPENNIRQSVMMFLASKKIEGLSEITLNSYGLQLTRFSNHMQKNIEDITAMDIRMYLANYSKTGIQNSTLATKIWTLKSFFGWLELEEYIPKNPMNKIKQTKVESKVREPLTMVELELIRDNCKTYRQKALLELFYSTGCRLDEVQKLNKSDINWQDMSIKVVGKGNKERVVYFNSTAKVYLRKYLMSRFDDCNALFVTERKPICRLGRRGIQREFNKMGEMAGINRKVFPHLLRHTNATTLANSGVDLTTIQRILGHTNPSTTQRYSKLSSNNVENTYRKHFL